jgi:hypothetical protein
VNKKPFSQKLPTFFYSKQYMDFQVSGADTDEPLVSIFTLGIQGKWGNIEEF